MQPIDMPALPPEFESAVYRQKWPELGGLAEAELEQHYRTEGERRGLQANRLANRLDFVRLVPSGLAALEIGPFCNPLLQGPHVRYFDVLPGPDLERRARELGHRMVSAPVIDFVSPVGDLGVVTEQFHSVLSSHCLEHQPDLILHLQAVAALLKPGGRYFALVPDHRYCFDAFMRESTIADVLDAHVAQRKVHCLRSVIEHRVLTTHNDPRRHWLGDHGTLDNTALRLRAALAEWEEAAGGYIDVHAWYFTARSLSRILGVLRETGYIALEVERLYPTRQFANEFWIVLRRR